MRAFVDNAEKNRQSKRRIFFGPAKNEAQLVGVLGGDAKGLRRKITSDEVRKILRDHGDPVAEARRSPPQAAITRSDFKRIRSIVERPDRIERGHETGVGEQAVKSHKKIGRYQYTVVEEMQPKRHSLVIKTMYKWLV